jgi:hypothetical protein
VIDLIVVTCNFTEKYASDVCKRLCGSNSDVKNVITWAKFGGQGQRPTPVIELGNIKQILPLMVGGARIPYDKKVALLKMFGFDNDIPISSCIESNLMQIISNAFADDDISLQHYVGRYFLDAYFQKYNIVVECDENGHKGYNAVLDAERTRFVDKVLKKPT